MMALLKFEDGKKVFESIQRDGGDLFKEMLNETGNILLVSNDGKRITKGNIPKVVKGSFAWIK